MNNKKRYLKVIGVFLAVLVFVGVVYSFYPGKQRYASSEKSVIVLKATDNQSDDYPMAQGLRYMAKLLDERSNGRIKMIVYSNAILGDEKDILGPTEEGLLDIGRISASSLTKYAPELNVYMMPFLFRDGIQQWKVLDGPVGQRLLDSLGNSGFVGLTYYDPGARSFYAKKPIMSPQDIIGQRVRILDDKTQEDMISVMGAIPMKTSFLEVYPSLMTGTLDAAENSPPSFYTTKHYEQANVLSLTEHLVVPGVIIISKKTWNSLSSQDQELIRQAAKDSSVYQRKLWSEFTEKAMQELRNNGVRVVVPDKESFRKAMAPLYNKYPEYKEMIKQIQDTN